MTDTTLFELGSVSKSVSSMAIGLMVDQKKLSYDEAYSLPYLKYPVNLINILSHTVGYNFAGNTQIEHGINRHELLNVLAKQSPVIVANDIFTWTINWPINLKYINSYYAMGWRVLRLKDEPNKELIFHGGYINGYRAYIGYIPNEKIGLVMLVNQATEIPVEDGMKLWSMYLPSSILRVAHQ